MLTDPQPSPPSRKPWVSKQKWRKTWCWSFKTEDYQRLPSLVWKFGAKAARWSSCVSFWDRNHCFIWGQTSLEGVGCFCFSSQMSSWCISFCFMGSRWWFNSPSRDHGSHYTDWTSSCLLHFYNCCFYTGVCQVCYEVWLTPAEAAWPLAHLILITLIPSSCYWRTEPPTEPGHGLATCGGTDQCSVFSAGLPVVYETW